MNFGDILESWENRKKDPKSAFSKMLNDYLPADSDRMVKIQKDADANLKVRKRNQLLALNPQKEIDLHGCKVQDALLKLEQFIKECKKENIKKILIIHGKGNHSPYGPVLQKKILQFIQQCPLTGEYGYADKTNGGTGAMWVILR